MNKRIRNDFLTASVFLAIFVVFTILLRFVDFDILAPDGSPVGFAFLNRPIAEHFPFNPFFYLMTEWLGYLAVFLATGFAVVGAYQWFRRKKIYLVDADILCLGALFAVTVMLYALFEVVRVNVRPVLLNGEAENSYPSSHTVLSVVVFSGTLPLLKKRTGEVLYTVLSSVLICFLVLTIAGRLLSGVHWFTDLIGGVLLSLSLLFAYGGLLRFSERRRM